VTCDHAIDGTISSSSEKCPYCGEFWTPPQTVTVGVPMEINDESGLPRSMNDLQDALHEVEKVLVGRNNGFPVPPNLFVMLPTIREALIELIEWRCRNA